MPKTAWTGLPPGARVRIWSAWAALLVPTLILAGMLYHTHSARIAQTWDERGGVAVAVTLSDTLVAVDAFGSVRSGAERERRARAVDAALTRLEVLDATLEPRIALGSDLGHIARVWNHLRQARSGREQRTSELVDLLVAASITISDRSLLTYDPYNDTINLGDALAFQYSTSIGQLTCIADTIAQTLGRPASLHERFALTRLETKAMDAEHVGVLDLIEAVHSNAALVPLVSPQSVSLDRANSAFAAQLDRYIDGSTPAARAANLVSGAKAVVREEHALNLRLGAVLDNALVQRIAAERKNEVLTAIASAFFTTVSFALVAAIIRGLSAARHVERLEAERARERAIAVVHRELVVAQEKFRVTFEQAPLGILIVESDLHTKQANPALEALVADVDTLLDADRLLFERTLAAGESQRFERSYQRPDARSAWAEVSLTRVARADDQTCYVLGMFRDVTQSKTLERQLVYDATHDALTGLPNRAYFADALRAALAGSSGGANRFALLFLDLDDFKLVNDNAGHQAGDALLQNAAERLRRALRGDATICRMGGDEFTILVPCDGVDDSTAIAARIITLLAEPFGYDGHALTVRASIGIVDLSDGSPSAEDVLRDADAAMYAAKALGGGRYVVAAQSLRR